MEERMYVKNRSVFSERRRDACLFPQNSGRFEKIRNDSRLRAGREYRVWQAGIIIALVPEEYRCDEAKWLSSRTKPNLIRCR